MKDAPKQKDIPKQIHIIWLGGDIPPKNRECIASFAKLNHGWKVQVWIDTDQLLTGERQRQVIAHHGGKLYPEQWQALSNRLGKGGDTVTIDYLSQSLWQNDALKPGRLRSLRAARWESIHNFCLANGIYLREVQIDLKMGKNAPIYQQELVNRGANFGSASDILRIEILLENGGIYVDTDVTCVAPLPSIQCHLSHPRFSAVHPKWQKGMTEQEWKSPLWWEQVGGQKPPKISNSIIASHPRCAGLEAYRSLINRNFKAMKNSDALRLQYMDDVRGSTIRMTGPAVAEKSSGFEKISKGMEAKAGVGQLPLSDKLYMRDNWYFPMFYVKDNYFHDWFLPAS
jgi:hypothetical protein